MPTLQTPTSTPNASPPRCDSPATASTACSREPTTQSWDISAQRASSPPSTYYENTLHCPSPSSLDKQDSPTPAPPTESSAPHPAYHPTNTEKPPLDNQPPTTDHKLNEHTLRGTT